MYKYSRKKIILLQLIVFFKEKDSDYLKKIPKTSDDRFQEIFHSIFLEKSEQLSSLITHFSTE